MASNFCADVPSKRTGDDSGEHEVWCVSPKANQDHAPREHEGIIRDISKPYF